MRRVLPPRDENVGLNPDDAIHRHLDQHGDERAELGRWIEECCLYQHRARVAVDEALPEKVAILLKKVAI